MSLIPKHKALICIDCECITDERTCPACSSNALVTFWRWWDRPEPKQHVHCYDSTAGVGIAGDVIALKCKDCTKIEILQAHHAPTT